MKFLVDTFFTKKLQLLSLLLLFSNQIFAQDQILSQYSSSQLFYNPASSGFSYAPKFNVFYRDQMPFYNRAFVNIGMSYDQYIDALHGGIGFTVQNERSMRGIYNSYQAELSYHLRIKLQNLNINIGMGAGLVNKSIQFNKLTFDDMVQLPIGFTDANGALNPSSQSLPSQEKYLRPDFSAGIFLFSKKAFGGFGVKHLTQPTHSFYGNDLVMPRNFNFIAGYEFTLDKKVKLTPTILAAYQGESFQANAGVQAKFQNFWTGLYYRQASNASQAAIFVLGFEKQIFKIGYSYDLGISRFASMKYGAHEINLVIQLEESEYGKRKRRMQKNIVCPSFIK